MVAQGTSKLEGLLETVLSHLDAFSGGTLF